MDELMTNVPLHLFHHGENFKLYETYGAHPIVLNGQKGYIFRVWAPRAVSVSVVGEFNNWQPDEYKMNKMVDGQSWELFIPKLKCFTSYKYCIVTAHVNCELALACRSRSVNSECYLLVAKCRQ